MSISADLSGKRIAILATNGFEQSELMEPLKRLREAGASVDVIAPEDGEIRGWQKKDWGDRVPVDKKLSEAAPADYDSLVLPGGPRLVAVAPPLVRPLGGVLKLVTEELEHPCLQQLLARAQPAAGGQAGGEGSV